MKTVWFIRHSESIANIGAVTHHHETIPLSEWGAQQAQRVSQKFHRQPDLIICSPFLRARQTAEPTINRFPGVRREIWPVEEFTYLSPASCVGTTAADRWERVNQYWKQCDPDYIDSEGAESFRQFMCRAQATINRLENLEEDIFVVVFSHAQFMRAVRFLRENGNLDIHEIMKQYNDLPRVRNAEIFCFSGQAPETDLEDNLPGYLQRDIDALMEGEKNHSTLLDCLWGEVYSSINCAEVDLAITQEQAAYLRKKYLYGDGLEKQKEMINAIVLFGQEG